MVQAARHFFFVFKAGQSIGAAGTIALQALTHDALKQHLAPLAVNRVRIEHPNRGLANRPGLQNGSALLENIRDRLKLRLCHRKRRTLDGRNPLVGLRVAQVRHGGDDNACRAIDLLQKFIVHQDTAIFSGNNVDPAAWSRAQFNAPATHFAAYRHDGIVFRDFTLFQLGDPNLRHPLGGQ